MDRAILFRFHKNTEICASRIKLLKEMNPETAIYGLGEEIENSEKLFEAGMEDLHVIEDKGSEWKWKNGDLAIKNWFENVGNEKEFDILHVIEWDLLLTEPLDKLYSHVEEDQVALTGLKPIEEAKEYGWKWVNDKYEESWIELRNKVEEDLNFSKESKGCILPAAALPRSFLEDYSDFNIPELCNDEVRVPLYAEALGYELIDTGFFGEWGSDQVYQYFNALGQEIEEEKIRKQLNQEDGRRAFHPVREEIKTGKVKDWEN